jgi:hypothetical protein
MRGHLLGPRERRVARHGPAGRIVVEGQRAAQVVDALQLVGDRLLDAVEIGVFVQQPGRTTLGAGTVVTHDVQDQRVVELAHVAQPIDQAPYLGVGIFGETCKDLHLAREQALLVGRQRGPVLDEAGLARQRRVFRHHAQRLLPHQRFFAQLIPALIEFALVLLDPGLRHLVRRVRGTGCEVHEEGPLGRQRLLRLQPLDGLVRHVGHEVVVRVVRQLHRRGAVIDQRRPLIGLATHEAVELVETRACGPAAGRAGDADLPGGGFVVFAELRGAVAVQTQCLGQRGHALRLLACVARVGGGDLGDAAHVVHVVVAAAQQCRARGRTQCRGVELVEAQAVGGQAVHGGHVDRAAESARLAEAHVVDQHDQHVGCPRGRFDLKARRRFGLARIELGVQRRLGLLDRQYRPVQFDPG